MEDLWPALQTATRFDQTLRIDRRLFDRMLEHYVAPVPYRRATFFHRMSAAEPTVVKGFAKPLRAPFDKLPPAQAGHALIDWLARRRNRRRHRVRTGTAGVCRMLTLSEIASKWQAGRTRFGVTDLHIRGTVMAQVIAPEVLSRFNLLPRSSPGARRQEMFSFVISSRGHLTDSHSDAPDSSNYCFAGRKLWLAWDTYEGARYGLQDVERVPVNGRARFDMQSWLSLRSARWLLVNPGETLFLPANMTHKVITLEIIYRRGRLLSGASELPAAAVALDRQGAALVEARLDRRARQSGGRNRQLRPRSADGVAAGAGARAPAMGLRSSGELGGSFHRDLPRRTASQPVVGPALSLRR